ncbi:hypothetical protein PMZ80_003004 [Knufia obscura]|uniref:Major facilitator superfamily (MFS) profile domain-containing protein n=2 Tax=Knufia TaxID=430999 RepID=A0AAN8EUJ8_9EURO|nr:hypothetical protein PMZ80_003004 [Knufia obscura]KAK5952408.1 hypothetical protein OHC33_006451 [Knufia fluminis]
MDNSSPRLTGTTSSSQTLHENEAVSPPPRVSDSNKDIGESDPVVRDRPLVQDKGLGTQGEDEEERAGSKQVITLSLSDPEHPNNWSKWKKTLVVSGGIMTVIHSTLSSSLPSNAIQYITRTFGVTSQIQQVLPISTFLMGYVFAPTLCGPLSENFGRKPVMLVSFLLFTIWTMACAVAPTWGSFLFFRFMCGVTASAPIACVSGIFADINADPRKRGRTMALFMSATTLGPVCAPPISGFFAQNTTWRWVFGFGTIFAAATIPFVVFLPETYAPILASKRAAKLRKETGNQNIIAQSDLQKKSFKYVMSVVMTRPFRMLFRELIVSTTCLYLALCYGIFYLYFEAYPIIFLGPDSVYNYSPGIAGLTFLPIGIGAVLAMGLFMIWDWFLARAQARKEPWSQREESRRLPLALVGGPLYGISIFWLGWSARPGVFWLAPVASGITFGIGFMLIFMAMLNYLSDAYMTFAASAQGIASTCRSLLGVLLPLAAHTMFQNLGIAWACSTLGFLSLLLAMVPVLFIIFGERIRANSKFCQELKALHEKELEEKESSEQSTSQQV